MTSLPQFRAWYCVGMHNVSLCGYIWWPFIRIESWIVIRVCRWCPENEWLQMIALFCKRALLKRLYSAKETCMSREWVMREARQLMVCTCIYTCVHTYTYIYTHTHTHTYVYGYGYVCTRIHIYTCVYTYPYIYTHTHTLTHMRVWVWVCVYTYIYIHICIYIYIHIHTHTHTHIRIWVWICSCTFHDNILIIRHHICQEWVWVWVWGGYDH